MAEEQTDAEKKGSLLRTLIIVGICVLAPAIVGLLAFQFFISPRLEAAALEETPPIESAFPAGVTTIELPEDRATVISDDPNFVPPLLVYQVAIVCDSQETADIVNTRRAHFIAMVSKLHRNRTMSELNDPYVQESILRQARQESNVLLEQFAPGAGHEVLEVMHLSFTLISL